MKLRHERDFHAAILRTTNVRCVRRDRVRLAKPLQRVFVGTQAALLEIREHSLSATLRQTDVVGIGARRIRITLDGHGREVRTLRFGDELIQNALGLRRQHSAVEREVRFLVQQDLARRGGHCFGGSRLWLVCGRSGSRRNGSRLSLLYRRRTIEDHAAGIVGRLRADERLEHIDRLSAAHLLSSGHTGAALLKNAVAFGAVSLLAIRRLNLADIESRSRGGRAARECSSGDKTNGKGFREQFGVHASQFESAKPLKARLISGPWDIPKGGRQIHDSISDAFNYR
ncbi:protein of unknown function (plasmid) [Caballeronia sp. S22]